ncbi:Uncharacterised protein [Yersinia pekkanenii]|uniref:Uncharacterized protein n=1 Tax=Yersinia pekkanenii TaxID=1288385 RepID=A0A0T9RST2_9GAMM|nr:Uncharacterised protein [Yersinia pekkanenii]
MITIVFFILILGKIPQRKKTINEPKISIFIVHNDQL